MKMFAALVLAALIIGEAGPGCALVDPPGALIAAQRIDNKGVQAAPVLAADKGRFRIVLDGQQVGSEDFEIAAAGKDWVARGTTSLHPSASAPSEVRATLRLAADGSPLSYEWSSKAQKKASATIEFKDGAARISLNFEGATSPFQQTLTFPSPRIAVLDNNLYHQYAILARLYDWNTRGEQSLPVLIPQDLTPGQIKLEAAGPQQVDGATLELLRVRTEDLEVQLYLDSSHRLMRLAAPASKVVVTRE